MKDKKFLILICISIFITLLIGSCMFFYISKDNNMEDNSNDINNGVNNESKVDSIDVYSGLYLDYQNNKITTDEYVKYSLYAHYDSSLLGSDYKALYRTDHAIDVEELINTYYNELSDSTLRYFAEKINLDGITFELDKENEEQNDSVALTDILFEKVYAKTEKVTNLNKAVLSSNGNFVIWYTTTGNSATDYSSAKKVADGLENTIQKYKDLFGKTYKYSSNVMSKGKTYKNQIKILENSNIDKSYLESAMQIYLVEYNNSALAQYVSGYGKAKEILNGILGGDDYGVIAYPYIVIKPSSFTDFERLEQLYNHELFHHYQKYILCSVNECNITDPYISEATANWASSLATNKTTNKGFLNEWAGTARKYSSDLMSNEFAKKNGIGNVGYALFVYLNNYSNFVNNGTQKIANSIYKKDALLYLEDNATKEELTKIQETIALNNLSQGYSNKNLLVDISKNKYPIVLKGNIVNDKSFDFVRTNKGSIDYYLLKKDSLKEYEITLVRDNNNVMATLIGKNGNKYELLQTSTIDKKNYIFNTNDYKDKYEEIYIAVLNILPGLENYYSLSVDETDVIEKEEIAEDDNPNSDSDSNNESITNGNISDDYTTINSVLLEKIRFKTYNPTYFWNSNDDFGSDIDTVFIVSKNGVPVKNYYEIENLSGIIFEYDSRYFGSYDSVKKRINDLYGISNLQIKNLENNIFSRHIKGETSKFYLEVYCMKYNDVYYAIELNVYKNNYTKNELNRIISEYHTIINTLEIL